MDNISSSVRPLKKGLFLKMGKNDKEVPCCGGLEIAAKKALQDSGKFLPWQVITISIDGKIIE